MAFQDLADIHSGGHPKRIQHDINRGAVVHIRHVFDRNDSGDHSLISVPAGHFVAGLQSPFDGNEHLDHLQHPGLQIVTCLEFPALFIVKVVKTF